MATFFQDGPNTTSLLHVWDGKHHASMSLRQGFPDRGRQQFAPATCHKGISAVHIQSYLWLRTLRLNRNVNLLLMAATFSIALQKGNRKPRWMLEDAQVKIPVIKAQVASVLVKHLPESLRTHLAFLSGRPAMSMVQLIARPPAHESLRRSARNSKRSPR